MEKFLKNYTINDVSEVVEKIKKIETYNHVCLMINLAVVSNRISSENSITLKNGLKKLFQINNIFDKFNKDNCIIRLINQ